MPSPYTSGFILVLAVYVASILLYCLRVIFDKKGLSRAALQLVLIGFIGHSLFLGLHFYQSGYPFLISSFEGFQMISGLIILIFLLLCLFYRFVITGIVLIPVAVVFYILSLTRIAAYQAPGHPLGNPWAFVHLVFIFVAVSVFMVSLVTGLLYLIRETRLKRKIIGGFFDRLPPLAIMESIHYRALYTGFIFFTIGIITGGGWSKSTLGVYFSNNVKQMLSLAVWIFFALFLNLRATRGWVGRKGILLSGIGFIGVLFLLTWVER